MKKILKPVLFATLCFTFISSCNNNDDNSSSSNPNVLKVLTRISKINYNNSGQIISTYNSNLSYNNKYDRLLKIEDDEFITSLNYDNNTLVSLNRTKKSSSSNTITQLVYNENKKLTRRSSYNENNKLEQDFNYFYNENGVLVKVYNQNFYSDQNKSSSEISNFEYSGNNIIKINTENIDRNGYISSSTTLYEFDNKNNPFRNSQDILRLLYRENFDSYNQNNITSERSNNSNNSSNVTYTYIYDNDNYPLSKVGKNGSGKIVEKIDYQYSK